VPQPSSITSRPARSSGSARRSDSGTPNMTQVNSSRALSLYQSVRCVVLVLDGERADWLFVKEADVSGDLHADLVLEGGGVKGIALAGAISVLEQRGYIFHKVAGTSAGSIVGALIAAGIGSEELHAILREISYRSFQDPPLLGRLGAVGFAAQVALHKGWCRGDYLHRWLSERLSEHNVRTFADLRLKDRGADAALLETPGRNYRFVAMASDISHGRLVRLPWDYKERFQVEPEETPVADAVRASIAIPYYFVPARLPDYIDGGTTWMVDGGMLSNFPVDVFDRTDGDEPRWPTFGIKLSSRPRDSRLNDVRGIVTLSKAMVSTMTGFYDRMHVDRAEVVARTIFVDTFGVKATDFALSPETAAKLFKSGQRAAATFLDGDDEHPAWDFEKYKELRRPSATSAAAAAA
jgi:NTE family protein